MSQRVSVYELVTQGVFLGEVMTQEVLKKLVGQDVFVVELVEHGVIYLWLTQLGFIGELLVRKAL